MTDAQDGLATRAEAAGVPTAWRAWHGREHAVAPAARRRAHGREARA